MVKKICQKVMLPVIGLLALACGGKTGQQGGVQPVKEYACIQIQPSVCELNSTYPATIKGVQDVEIRPKVSGFITKLCVDEGAKVRKGQTLFLIDRVQYESAVEVARAAVKLAEANVATAELTAKTKQELAAKNIISQYELQTAQNELLSRQAALAQAKAQLTSASNDLSYTNITSPSDGVVGTIPFRIGSLVGTTNTLTTVSDISRMYVYFSMNEKDLLKLTRQEGEVNNVLEQMPEVQLILADGSVYGDKGKIATLSGMIDQTTGAVTMRATFPNPAYILRSGGTGKVLIPQVMTDALQIPQKATYELQDKKFVYTVSDSSTVVNTPIEVLTLNDGQNYVVTSGLKPGDKVVVEGITSLKNGMKIKPVISQAEATKVTGEIKGQETPAK